MCVALASIGQIHLYHALIRRHSSVRVYNVCTDCVWPSTLFDDDHSRTFAMEEDRPLHLSTLLSACMDLCRWLAGDEGHAAIVQAGGSLELAELVGVSYLLCSQVGGWDFAPPCQ